MKFKIFEQGIIDQGAQAGTPDYVREPQGLLRKSAAVKRWEKIGVGKSDTGYGVFAIDDIRDNEIIEECNVIEVPRDEVKGAVIMDYMFKIGDGLYVLALGCGSLYNHRNQPNAMWTYDAEKKLLVIKSVRPIEMGEQIFISYGRDYFSTRGQNMKAE
jgi:hypothetical protein